MDQHQVEPAAKQARFHLTPLDLQAREMAMIKKAVDAKVPVLVMGPECSGKSTLIALTALQHGRANQDVLTVNVGEQTDPKSLLGSYTVAPGKPGQFKWRAGVVFEAARRGKWLVLEDFQLANPDFISIIRPILDSRKVYNPMIGETVAVHQDFRLFVILTGCDYTVPLSKSFWIIVQLEAFDQTTLCALLPTSIDHRLFVDMHNSLTVAPALLLRLAKRMTMFKYSMVEEDRLKLFADCVDIFIGHFCVEKRRDFMNRLSHILCITDEQIEGAFTPNISRTADSLQVGRVTLKTIAGVEVKDKFVLTRLSSMIMEQIACCLFMAEPVLLVGETGTGKTTIVQHLAHLMGADFMAVNMSQQSEAGDLIGGFRPFSPQIVARGITDKFLTLFAQTFSKSKNADYLSAVHQAYKQADWVRLIALCKQIIEKLQTRSQLSQEWSDLDCELEDFEKCNSGLLFHFQEGHLATAIRKGHWLLLDEINLASPETLNVLSGLLRDEKSSITLTERGDTEPIPRHPNFRLFACMNPATDVGKRDLPSSIRRRFTEFYVDEADCFPGDLLHIITSLLGPALCSSDPKLPEDISELFYKLKEAVVSGKLADGNRRRPLFNLRTLTRPIRFGIKAASVYGVRMALFEGFSLAFLTQLDVESKPIAMDILNLCLQPNHNTGRIVNERWTRNPSVTVFDRYVLETGPQFDGKKSVVQLMSELESQFVLTASVKANMMSIARGVMAADYPILLEGPTSSGKTSSIEYLARLSGHPFSRINNHEHTDLQEYLGSYTISAQGKLEFKEGLLLRALREGHWLVLDELNLAPTDVLEALNRLLDDNRELFVAELEEVVKPHPNFRLFATQNPAGSVYGGRKVLSRAFRSRFLEICIPDIPVAELEIILTKKAKIAPSQAKKLSAVYSSLQEERSVSANVFAGRHALVTLRDLFRWAGRPHVTNEDLGRIGYICLAERMRNSEDRLLIASILCKVFKLESIEPLPYQLDYTLPTTELIVWTRAMKRLNWLVQECIKAKEPVLLVGETGCGKTTIVQVIAASLNRQLVTVNCHQNTETSDLLGSQRPARGDSEELFEWRDGPLVQAMRRGELILLDEISLADDSVLERLNSVLEPSRSLTLAEAPTSPVIVAEDGFAILATMNPGGDYGKKELSPALRSRFTEIWVPNITDLVDIHDILKHRLVDERLCEWIEAFWCWYRQQPFGDVLSMRDLSSWIDFIACAADDKPLAFLQGALMLFVDRLDDDRVKQVIVERLSRVSGLTAIEYSPSVQIANGKLYVGPFGIDCHGGVKPAIGHHFNAPTTFKCALRTARAMQLHKPVLLEGSPGVGKTALVTALAAACGARLCRINLSDQTDLADLFGADLPVDGGRVGQFAWRDGPFLAALKRGDWILLDELNLASQSVLEGLNACLDHRATVYIPELDRHFTVSQQSRIFGAQNPVSQGGGRKGLPRSFLNRFSIVWFDRLQDDDYRLILSERYAKVPVEVIDMAVSFNNQLNELINSGQVGREGRPWEFNLRDLFRWLDMALLMDDYIYPLKMIYVQRFRTLADRKTVGELIGVVFGAKIASFTWNVSSSHIQLGKLQLSRPSESRFQLLHNQKELLESIVYALNGTSMVILTGPSGCGKSALIELAAEITGKQAVRHFILGPDTDSLDLLGCFEQSDPERTIRCNRPGSAAYERAKLLLETGASTEGCFEWVDGPLARALEEGHWLVLDHANSCSPSVLDRINCLLERDGVLVLSEQGVCQQTGQLRTIVPHPDFRLFMTVLSGGGHPEISRAMRNRGVELAVLPSGAMDQLAVMRAAAQVSVNSQLGMGKFGDLREACMSSVLHKIVEECGDLSEMETWWCKFDGPMPISVADGDDHVTMMSEAGCRDALESLRAARKIGFKSQLLLIGDQHEVVKQLHSTGMIWKAAATIYNPRLSDYQYPQDTEFLATWSQQYLCMSIKRAHSAARFHQIARLPCSTEHYLACWSDKSVDVNVDHLAVSATSKWQMFIDRCREYSLLKRDAADHPFYTALHRVHPQLKRVHLMTPALKDLSVARLVLSDMYVSLLLRDFLSIFGECSVVEYGELKGSVSGLQEILKECCQPNMMTFSGPSTHNMKAVMEWLCRNGDPNEHMLSQTAIQQAIHQLQRDDCLLQRRFLYAYNGRVENEGEVLGWLEETQRQIDNQQHSCIEPSESRKAVLSVVKNAQTFVQKLLLNTTTIDNNILTSLVSFRQSLMSQPANCFDLTVPIVSDLDTLLTCHIPKLHSVACDTPIDSLRKAAIRACEYECPIVASMIEPTSALIATARNDKHHKDGHFAGVQEDEQLEREIEAEFFTDRLRHEEAHVTVFKLFGLCARPSKNMVKSLQLEQSYHSALHSSDSAIHIDSFFKHCQQLQAGPKNFYTDPQPEQTILAVPLLERLSKRIRELLEEFEGHDVLENLLAQCERYCNGVPVNQLTLVAAALALERILQKANDWQQYTAKQYSLQDHLTAITDLVIQYRRAELENWRHIFEMLTGEYEDRVAATWHSLAQLLLGGVVVREEVVKDIVKTMEEYLMSGQLGQFKHRLQLVEDFAVVMPRGAKLKSVLEVVVAHFAPIMVHLQSVIEQHKRPLEENLRSFLKTVHWADHTYWSTRDCIQKSHRKMAQFVRKCRELLDRPVASVLTTFVFTPRLDLLSDRSIIGSPLDQLCDDMEARMADLRPLDDVAIKQRAVLDYLSVLKDLQVRLTSRRDYDLSTDTTGMLMSAGEWRVDPHRFTNCLHQFAVFANISQVPHPDLGVRVMDSFQCASGQLLRMVADVTGGFGDYVERVAWLLEESLYRVDHLDGACCKVSLLEGVKLERSDYLRVFHSHGHSVKLPHSGVGDVVLDDHYVPVEDLVGALEVFNTALQVTTIENYTNHLHSAIKSLYAALPPTSLFTGSKTQLKRARQQLTAVKDLHTQITRSVHKFVFVSLSVMSTLTKDGYCRPEDPDSDQPQQPDAKEQSGTGMAEGQGEKNVNDEFEFEEQLNGLQGEQPEPDQRTEREEKELEMQQDFDAQLERLLLDDQDDDDDVDDEKDEDDHDDQKAEKADSDAERQQMDPDWDKSDGDSDSDSDSDSEGDSERDGEEGDDMDLDMSKAEKVDDNQANEDGKERGDQDDGDSGSEDDGSVASSVEGDVEDGTVSEQSEFGSNSDSEDTSSTHNPDPDQANEDTNMDQEAAEAVQQETADSATARKLDQLGDDQSTAEPGLQDTNVAQQPPTDPGDHQTAESDQHAQSKTIHDIQAATDSSAPHPDAIGQPSSDRQLYEHAATGQSVSARADSVDDRVQHTADDRGDDEQSHPDKQQRLEQQRMDQERTDSTPLLSGNTTNHQHTDPQQQQPEEPYVLTASDSHQLAVELCEKLRLVLEPTVRSRLQGDYKSGKRLNLRKIIPFIASGYRRDKIWLRRTKPHKRDYQIDICLDASRSMRDNGADRQALTASAALREGLGLLEAGSVNVYSFGDTVRLLCDNDTLTFSDEASDFCALLHHITTQHALEPPSTSTWRLSIIMSDGICQEHELLRQLVNKCLNMRILPFLVIMDPSGKISDLSHVHFGDDKKVKFTRYLSTIPFEHYVIVKDVCQLPVLLSDALQQWFQMQ